MSSIAVLYFSPTGTTKRAAAAIAKAAGGKLIELKPAVPYTRADLDWNDPKSRSTLEMNDSSSRPQLAALPDLSGCKAVFLGFPIWWYQEPRLIDTLVESGVLNGLKVFPFATSGGSGTTRAEKNLHALGPKVLWQPGQLVNSGAADWAEKAVQTL